MRIVVFGMLLLLAACGTGPVTSAHAAYQGCLEKKGVDGCQTEKAQFDAALAVADARSRRIYALGGVPKVDAYQPVQQPVRQPINCINAGGIISCY